MNKSRTELRKKKKIRNKFILYSAFIALLIVILALVINFKSIKQSYDWATLKPEQKLDVPLERQLPDLPNGCEVTSLSMLLNYYHIKINKDELAQNIKHVSSYSNDGKYRGNPHIGFVGYMSQANGGWCVYNEPLYDVARRYTNRIQNATGSNFIEVIHLVSSGHPVMIITTLKFSHVNDMQTWNTEQGKVNVTPSSHACVITGYNKAKKIVYVNDPYGYKNRPVEWKNIKASYNQQGKQALYIE